MPKDYTLSSDALRSRQCIAAFALRFCRRILEIGGGAWPISYHLTMPTQSLTVVDPEVKPFRAVRWNGHICRIRHLPIHIESYEPEEPADGLCMLAFPGWAHMDRACVMGHVRAANTVVIETAANNDAARAGLEDVISASDKAVIAEIVLNCRGNNIPTDYRFALRELYVLKG